MRVARRCAVALLVVVLASLVGCKQRIGQLSVVTTRNVNLAEVDLDKAPTERMVVGDDTVFILVFIPFGIPTLQDAVEDALAKGGGDVMTDVTVHRRWWWFIVGQEWIEVTGDVVKTRARE